MEFKGFDDIYYDWADFNCGMGVCCDMYAIGFVLPGREYDDYLFKLVDGVVVVVNNNAGTVDYIRGEIKLTTIIFTSSTSTAGIEIEAIPESNDVLALKDIYLELDTTKLNVSVLEDVITSGENTSATQYAVTSSYVNGNYTR